MNKKNGKKQASEKEAMQAVSNPNAGLGTTETVQVPSKKK